MVLVLAQLPDKVDVADDVESKELMTSQLRLVLC